MLTLSKNKLIIICCCLHTEVIKEVENDGDRLTELLKNNSDYLELDCLNRGLIAAGPEREQAPRQSHAPTH